MLQRLTLGLVAALVLSAAAPAFAAKGFNKLDEMSLERWALLRETERYQLKVAEKYYLAAKGRRPDDPQRVEEYKIAAGEYEKYLTLYESSEGAPYAQLQWSHCQVKLQMLKTAVKDGFQSVIDYWPDSPEAVAAAYLIGKTYKDMGDLGPAKLAYQKVLSTYGDEMVATLARLDLADIARIEQNRPERVAALKELVFKADRTGDAGRQIADASATLAVLLFDDGAFVDGKDALATTYKEPTLAGELTRYVVGPIRNQLAVAETKDRGLKLADATIAYLREQQVAAPKDDEGKRDKDLAYKIAAVQNAAGRPEEAVKLYEGLVKAYPGDDGVLGVYGDWLREKRRFAEARAVFGRMQDLIVGQSRTAGTYRNQVGENKPLLAVPIYEGLVSQDAEHAEKWQYQLGEAYREAGKHKEAIAALQECNGSSDSLKSMASSYRSLNQPREAIGLYNQLAAAYPESAAWALLEIGHSQESAGQTEPAIATFQQVCRRFPRSEYAARAHQHLNNKYKIFYTDGGEAKKQ